MADNIIFFIIIIIVGYLIINIYNNIRINDTDKVFHIDNNKFSLSKIYKPCINTWLYTEKDKDDKPLMPEKNYICDNYDLLNVNKDIYLLQRS
jgi:hypothetical protein